METCLNEAGMANRNMGAFPQTRAFCQLGADAKGTGVPLLGCPKPKSPYKAPSHGDQVPRGQVRLPPTALCGGATTYHHQAAAGIQIATSLLPSH